MHNLIYVYHAEVRNELKNIRNVTSQVLLDYGQNYAKMSIPIYPIQPCPLLTLIDIGLANFMCKLQHIYLPKEMATLEGCSRIRYT